MLHPHTELYGQQYRQPNKHETTSHAHQRVDKAVSTLHERVAAEQALGGQLMDGGREQ